MGQHVTRLVQVLLRPLARFLAKRASKIQAGAGRIDTHIHALPPAYLAELSKAGVSANPSAAAAAEEEEAGRLGGGGMSNVVALMMQTGQPVRLSHSGVDA